MELAAKTLLLTVAFLHGYFLVLEMFLWTKPYGLKTFGKTKEEMEATKVMAKNQGLYNGFLAAGLVCSAIDDSEKTFALRVFFLSCVIVAGVYGGLTASKKIMFVQALPAIAALVVSYLAERVA